MTKHRNNYILYVFLLCAFFSSCVTSKKVNYFQEPDRTIPHYADTLSYEEYKIRVNDRLYIQIYSLNKELMQMYNAGGGTSNGNNWRNMNNTNGRNAYELFSYLVDEEGNINFPTIGKVQVLGMTTREAKHVMEDRLATLLHDMPGFKTISVEVHIMERSFSLIGVKSMKVQIDKEKMTIFEALARMGNLQTFSDRSRVKVIREIDGKPVIKTFDLRSKEIVNSEFYYVEPNDIIYVRELPGKSFGITSASGVLATVSTTLSFGVFVYTIVQTGINHVKKYAK